MTPSSTCRTDGAILSIDHSFLGRLKPTYVSSQPAGYICDPGLCFLLTIILDIASVSKILSSHNIQDKMAQ